MKKYLLLLLIVAIFYGGSLRFGFSQDDFYHLIISRFNSITEFLQFFVPSKSWVFYRPLSTQVYYSLFFGVFKLEAPFYMHLFALLLHTFNAFLVCKLFEKLGIKKNLALLGASLYAISGVHFLSLYYIGATQELLATFFSLLLLITPHFFIWIIPALMSKEIVVRTIPILFVLEFVKKRSWLNGLKITVPPIVLIVLYFIFRLVFGLGSASEYQLVFAPQTTLATIMWYVYMTFGLPEYILSFGLSGGLVNFTAYAKSLGILTTTNLVLSFLLIILFAIIVITNLKKKNFSLLLTTSSLWLIALSPIIFLPTHRYAHYLDLSLLAVIYLVIKQKSKFILFAFCLLFAASSLTSIMIDEKTHWTTQRSSIATHLQGRIQSEGACQYKAWYLSGDTEVIKEVNYAIMYDNGPNVICNRDDIKVLRDKKDDNLFTLELTKEDLKR